MVHICPCCLQSETVLSSTAIYYAATASSPVLSLCLESEVHVLMPKLLPGRPLVPQAERLSSFYDMCKSMELSRSFQFPTLEQVPAGHREAAEGELSVGCWSPCIAPQSSALQARPCAHSGLRSLYLHAALAHGLHFGGLGSTRPHFRLLLLRAHVTLTSCGVCGASAAPSDVPGDHGGVRERCPQGRHA